MFDHRGVIREDPLNAEDLVTAATRSAATLTTAGSLARTASTTPISIWTIAAGALDEITVATFLSFVNDNLQELIHPEDVLDAEDFKPVSQRLKELAKGVGDAKRVDRLATISTRLYLHVTREGYEPGERHADNLVAFLLHDDLPGDLRYSLYKDLLDHGAVQADMVRNPELAKTLLVGM